MTEIHVMASELSPKIVVNHPLLPFTAVAQTVAGSYDDCVIFKVIAPSPSSRKTSKPD